MFLMSISILCMMSVIESVLTINLYLTDCELEYEMPKWVNYIQKFLKFLLILF